MKRFARTLLFMLCQVPTALTGQTRPVPAVEPRPLLTIGQVLGDSPDHSFTEITAIAVVGDSILVLEGSANEIRIFDHQGRFLGRIGRSGEGPGEFAWPTALRIVSEEIAVIDLRLRRQSFFSLKGQLLRTEPLGRLRDQALAGSVAMRSGVMVAETAVTFGSETGAFPERVIVLLHPHTQRVDTVARYSTGYVPYKAPDSYGFLPYRAGSEGDWAAAGDSLLALVSGEPPILQWWLARERGLALEGRTELPVRPEAFTREDARELLERANDQRRTEGDDLLPRSVAMDVPPYWGQVGQLVISDDHECWVQWDQPRSSEDNQWFRIDLKDRRIERTSLPAGFRMLNAVGDKLYGFVLSEYDTPVLTVLRLRKVG